MTRARVRKRLTATARSSRETPNALFRWLHVFLFVNGVVLLAQCALALPSILPVLISALDVRAWSVRGALIANGALILGLVVLKGYCDYRSNRG